MSFQLQLPFNSPVYYALLALSTVMYYTYAYAGAAGDVRFDNPRTEWYRVHHRFITRSQVVLFCSCICLFAWLMVGHYRGLLELPVYYWVLLAVIGLSALSYYGLLPHSAYRLNLRNSGWAKAFVIGFVWACTINILPLVDLQVEAKPFHADPVLVLWLFVKNWMFCTVNAIMFDLKDYADDANHELKTFVVRFGLRKTIHFVLIPLLVVGILSVIAFTIIIRHFPLIPILFNLIPFACLLAVAYSLHTRKPILFYLIVIDGLLLVKALCGIAGTQFMNLHH